MAPEPPCPQSHSLKCHPVNLFFSKGSAGCFPAVAGTASLNVNMRCCTLIIAVINTLYRLTINTDDLTGMVHRTGKAVTFVVGKALTAGIICTAGMLSSYHNIALTAIFTFVENTIIYSTS